jgi:hypothetical protein
MKDQDLKKIFATKKVDIPDEGFSERVVRQLPERKNLLPQIVMIMVILFGFGFVFAIQDVRFLLEQIVSLITSITQFQTPSPGAVITYLSLLIVTGTIGYSVVQVVDN